MRSYVFDEQIRKTGKTIEQFIAEHSAEGIYPVRILVKDEENRRKEAFLINQDKDGNLRIKRYIYRRSPKQQEYYNLLKEANRLYNKQPQFVKDTTPKYLFIKQYMDNHYSEIKKAMYKPIDIPASSKLYSMINKAKRGDKNAESEGVIK